MQKLLADYDQFEEFLGKILRLLCTILLGTLLVIFVANIILRYFRVSGLAWFEEVVTFCFAWMAFLGTVELWRKNSLFNVDVITHRFKKDGAVAKVIRILIGLICLVFFAITTYYSIGWISRIKSTTPALSLPTSYLYSCIPVSMMLMGVMTIRDLADDLFIKNKGEGGR